MSITVEITDQFGGYIRSFKDEATGLINVEVYNGRTDETTDYLFYADDPEVISWLEGVYQPLHLKMLLGK